MLRQYNDLFDGRAAAGRSKKNAAPKGGMFVVLNGRAFTRPFKTRDQNSY
jgi:hypothetical protein